jgi:subtilisin family serine protease
MKHTLKAYKITGNQPAIYVEIDALKPPCDVVLYCDNVKVASASAIRRNPQFYIDKVGCYTVSATEANNVQHQSNSLHFYQEEFESSALKQKKTIRDEPNFDFPDRIIDNIENYYIEVKINKGTLPSLETFLATLPETLNLQRKEIDLRSFPADHSIYHYEYYHIYDNIDKARALTLCQQLQSLPDVIYCTLAPDTKNMQPPETAVSEKRFADKNAQSDTPDFSPLQGYLEELHGMNVRKAWLKGVTGEEAIVRHLDFGIYRNHEDFQEGNIIVVNSRSEEEDCDHGTASVGCISAGNNGFGVTGIAHGSLLYFYDTDDFDLIVEQANPGDIVSIDNQYNVDNFLVPMTSSKSWWDRIKNLTEKGVIVILAAGNGGVDLSDPTIFPDYGDSGSLLVGACSPSNGLRLDFSNYGHSTSLINSWGDDVVSTGYSSLQKLPGNNRNYTQTFSGTSSATPLCAGALALLQSYAKKQAVILTPESMKEILSATDYEEGVAGKIGKRPNVDRLLTFVDRHILAPLCQKNPFPASVSYDEHKMTFTRDTGGVFSVNFDFRQSGIIDTGAVACFPEQGPSELEWFAYGYSNIKVPVADEKGNIRVIYLRVRKMMNGVSFTMNSAAGFDDMPPNQFRLHFQYLAADNVYLEEGNYRGTFPVYIKSYEDKGYALPVMFNVAIN